MIYTGILTLFILHSLPRALGEVVPQQVAWSQESLGPDGPWNAVEVSLGSQPKIALFPGRMWHTFVSSSDYCSINASVPHCASGTYNTNRVAEDAANGGVGGRLKWRPPTQQLLAGIKVHGESKLYLDTVDLLSELDTIDEHSLAVIETEDHMLEYPGGTRYPIFTGCFSIGAPDPMQIFETASTSRDPPINATMIPWNLKSKGETASSSYGLHIGSAGPTAKMQGSLLFGGYDRNRVLGDVLSLGGDISNPVGLRDISIQVVKGPSPFGSQSPNSEPAKSMTGLLGKGNSSIDSAGLPVLLDPCSPYFTLPKSTCDSIASHLPVSYNDSLGLYLWNVSSPRYRNIVASASVLAFTLIGASNTQEVTINVPFRHLNLTLSPPFTDSPTPYFPCFTGGTGTFVLGRAFLQDAFLGGNWEMRKTFVAQAPGPNVPARADPVNVEPGDSTIEASNNDWVRSWEGFWTVLKTEDVKDSNQDDTYTPSNDDGGGDANGVNGGDESVDGSATSGEQQNGGLSPGIIAAIAVASAVVGMAIVGAAVFFRYRRKKKPAQAPATEPLPKYYSDPDTKAVMGWVPPAELPNTSRPYEVHGTFIRHEMLGDYPPTYQGVAR
ncbi:hypothetical protein C7999DRAFT_11939 [Corynascus novoguineensis]|uniref:Peptidase A1 domain-containing protein n=1 Tax=Corynascus novoguineensis TaxID=1126955 RepID=A0AAN7CY48_9PEZI|nr:hypothetical protein C7999DRAFT_11939 [Corynascus novoguineensis]